MLRDTTAPDWEREIPVATLRPHTIEDFSIDDAIIGVKAIDRDGNESMVAAYLEPVTQRRPRRPQRPPGRHRPALRVSGRFWPYPAGSFDGRHHFSTRKCELLLGFV